MDSSKLSLINLPLRRRCFFLTDTAFLAHLHHLAKQKGQEGTFEDRVEEILLRHAASHAHPDETGADPFLPSANQRLQQALAAWRTDPEKSVDGAWCEYVEELLCSLESVQHSDEEKRAVRALLGAYVRAFYNEGRAYYLARETSGEGVVARSTGGEHERVEEGVGNHSASSRGSVRVTWSVGGPVQETTYRLLSPV